MGHERSCSWVRADVRFTPDFGRSRAGSTTSVSVPAPRLLTGSPALRPDATRCPPSLTHSERVTLAAATHAKSCNTSLSASPWTTSSSRACASSSRSSPVPHSVSSSSAAILSTINKRNSSTFSSTQRATVHHHSSRPPPISCDSDPQPAASFFNSFPLASTKGRRTRPSRPNQDCWSPL
jgi:hypothetical protein